MQIGTHEFSTVSSGEEDPFLYRKYVNLVEIDEKNQYNDY